jgi:integrase
LLRADSTLVTEQLRHFIRVLSAFSLGRTVLNGYIQHKTIMKLYRLKPEYPWYCRAFVGGKEHRFSTGELDHTKARTAAMKRIKDLDRASDVDGAFAILQEQLRYLPSLEATAKVQELVGRLNCFGSGPDFPLESLWDRWASLPENKNRKSLADDAARWRQFLAWLARERGIEKPTLECVTPDMAQAYIHHVDGLDLVKHTRRLMVGLTERVFETEREKGCLAVNLFAGATTRLKVDDTGSTEQREGFTDDELKRILGALDPRTVQSDPPLPCRVDEHRRELWLLTQLALTTGLDSCDVAGLTRDQLKVKDGLPYVEIVRSKLRKRGGKKVEVALRKDVVASLERWAQPDAQGYLLPQLRKGFQGYRGYITERFGALLNHLGIATSGADVEGRSRARNVKGLKSLRHNFVTKMASASTNPLIAQRMAGHSTLGMTLNYTHPDLAQKAAAVERLALPAVSETAEVNGKELPK